MESLHRTRLVFFFNNRSVWSITNINRVIFIPRRLSNFQAFYIFLLRILLLYILYLLFFSICFHVLFRVWPLFDYRTMPWIPFPVLYFLLFKPFAWVCRGWNCNDLFRSFTPDGLHSLTNAERERKRGIGSCKKPMNQSVILHPILHLAWSALSEQSFEQFHPFNGFIIALFAIYPSSYNEIQAPLLS